MDNRVIKYIGINNSVYFNNLEKKKSYYSIKFSYIPLFKKTVVIQRVAAVFVSYSA